MHCHFISSCFPAAQDRLIVRQNIDLVNNRTVQVDFSEIDRGHGFENSYLRQTACIVKLNANALCLNAHACRLGRLQSPPSSVRLWREQLLPQIVTLLQKLQGLGIIFHLGEGHLRQEGGCIYYQEDSWALFPSPWLYAVGAFDDVWMDVVDTSAFFGALADRRCCWSFVAPAKMRIPSSGQPDGPTNLKLGRLMLHHWKDWVFVVLLVTLYIGLEKIHPYRRYIGELMFSTGRYSYPLLDQTVPAYAVPVIALVIPIVFILGFFIWNRMSRDLHHSILGLVTAVFLTAVITDALKDGLGYHRPDFYARCFGSVTAPAVYGPNGDVQCTGSASNLKQGYKSFPSGHASGSFAGLGYLSMYLAGKLGFFDKNGHLWKLFPIVLPLVGATLIGISRIDNYWHHWFDVFVGALIGLIVAYFCYRQHYPSLFDDEAARPLPFISYHQRANVINSNAPSHAPPSEDPDGVPTSNYPAV